MPLVGSIFLIPNGTFFAELILFLLVLGIVAKFILPPIDAARSARAETIRSAVHESDEGLAEADRLVAERRRVLDAARDEARGLLEDAAAAAAELFEQGRARGQDEHDRTLADAQRGIDEERQSVEGELLAKLDGLVVAAASQVVGQPIDLSSHRQIVDAAVARAAGVVSRREA
ncbi:MAG: F0F1 ATP synthase subunit B [Acidimicrobiales bacterium]